MKNNMKTEPKSKAIKSLDVPLAPAAAGANETSTEKLTLVLGTEEVPNNDVESYNDAAAQEKAWKKIKDDKKPKIQNGALGKLYEYNTDHPDAPLKTVCVVDSTGAACNVSLKDTYGNVAHDPTKVTKGLAALGQIDPNKFVAEKVVISFDTSVFYDEKGNLRVDFYTDVMESMSLLALQHDVRSPFSSAKVVTVKEGFAEKRWQVFTEAQQERVTELFPATVSLTPLAPEKTPKA